MSAKPLGDILAFQDNFTAVQTVTQRAESPDMAVLQT
jgi:hypothetical protein